FGRRAVRKLNKALLDFRRNVVWDDAVRNAALAEHPADVAVGLGQGQDRPARPQVFIELGWHAQAPARRVEQEKQVGLRHVPKRSGVSHLPADLHVLLESALANRLLQAKAGIAGAAKET